MLKIDNLQKKYKSPAGSPIEVFKDFNLKVSEGEFVAIFGPNGCGKTTLLNIIAGIIKPDNGLITFKEKSIKTFDIGYVFQDYRNSLFPWQKIEDNISFPLKIKGRNKWQRKKAVKELCENYNCSLNLECYPYQLSGGQQQLVALLRGLIIKPDIYLLDEPFSSLDYQTALTLQKKLGEIWQRTKITTIFVSHEIDEVILLAQKIVILSNRPARVIKIFQNPLPYPRNITLLQSPEAIELKKKIFYADPGLLAGNNL